MPTNLPLPVLPMPVEVAVCGPGTEQIGSFCRQCDLNTYDFDGLNCLPCPYGRALQANAAFSMLKPLTLAPSQNSAYPRALGSSLRHAAAGGFCPGGSNGEATPLQSQENFWRSSATATELFACPESSCMGTPYYSGNAVGDAACINGTTGPVCAVCQPGYYQLSAGCAYGHC